MNAEQHLARLLFLTLSFVLPFASPAFSQEKEESIALSLFKEKVANFDKFFSRQPTLLLKQSVSKSPTGVAFDHRQIRLLDISYDVRKTDSLISPLLGLINVEYKYKTNRSCGDFKYKNADDSTMVLGFTSYEGALKYRDTCFKIDDLFQPDTKRVQFSFAFQENRWVYKNVIDLKYNAPDFVLATALGQPVEPGLRVEDNKEWEELVK